MFFLLQVESVPGIAGTGGKKRKVNWRLLLFEEAALAAKNSVRTSLHVGLDFHVNPPSSLIGRATAGPSEKKGER
jgi:hypothetical protein